MAGGIPLRDFVDFSINTGPAFMSGHRRIVNETSRRSYLLGSMLKGRPETQVLQGGTQITETLKLRIVNTFKPYLPGDSHTWQNPQSDITVAIPWRFHLDHMSWEETEYELQLGSSGGGNLIHKYKDMDYSKKQRLWTSIVEGMEDLLWRVPNETEMEGTGTAGKYMYSMPTFINEGGALTSQAWTTIETIPLATNTEWDNYRTTYGGAAPEANDGGLFNTFDDVMISIDFKRSGLGQADPYYEAELQKGPDLMICCGKEGKKLAMRLHRAANDSLIQKQDAAYPMPRYDGVPINDVAALDTAALYKDTAGTALVAEGAADDTGPRYYFTNTKYLNMVFHTRKYFKMADKPKEPENQVGTFIVPVQCWGNMTCTSLRRQAFVAPDADV